MTTAPRRRDAARNRQQITDVARRFVDDGVPLRLNDVAREAVIGVATVYRHFPTPEALLETLARPALDRLAGAADRALTEDDAWDAFAGFLRAGIDAQLEDATVQPVIATGTHALPETADLVNRLHDVTGRLLDRVRAQGSVRTDLTRLDVVRLMCGTVFAATVHAEAGERAALTRRYLDVVLTGLRQPADRASSA